MGRHERVDVCSIRVAIGDLSEKCQFSKVQEEEEKPAMQWAGKRTSRLRNGWVEAEARDRGWIYSGVLPLLSLTPFLPYLLLCLSLDDHLFPIVFWFLFSLVYIWPCLFSGSFIPFNSEFLFHSLSILLFFHPSCLCTSHFLFLSLSPLSFCST